MLLVAPGTSPTRRARLAPPPSLDGKVVAQREGEGRVPREPEESPEQYLARLEQYLESLVAEKDQALYWIATPKAPGVFIALGGNRRRFCFNTAWYPGLD